MKYNFNVFKKNCLKNLLKFGKIKSNFIRLKKIFKFLNFFLFKYFNKKIKLSLIKLFYKKGDFSLVGELSFSFYKKKYFLK
ncbi:MAG: hypothetical protein NVS84_00890 [Candidatus Carsonella ruddii]|nr:MAG: hypothetical protein NVS84_00890 [Candidatus Carsonella ruddii]WMC19419.1 MAG: hypothetical protein NVS85_00890 [Candidatus Carsonella ruddii]